MKILYLIYGPQSGVIKSLSRVLVDKGNTIEYFNAADAVNYRVTKYLPSLKPKDVYNIYSSILQFGHNWRAHFYFTSFAFKTMSRFAEEYINNSENDFDIILQSGVLFSPFLRGKNRKYCLYLDHTYKIAKKYQKSTGLVSPLHCDKKWEAMEEEVYRIADRIFVMSENVKNSLINDYEIEEEKIFVVGAGPNLSISSNVNKHIAPNNKILFVGKDFIAKGGETLLKAFEIVSNEIPNAELTIVGEEIKINGKNISVKGYVKSKEEMNNLYRSSSIFVLPTLREAFGLSFLEAMSHKLPCIGTNIEAIPEIIEDGVTGYVVPPNDPTTLAKKIISLLKDRILMEDMGEKGYQKVINRFTWEKVGDKINKELNVTV